MLDGYRRRRAQIVEEVNTLDNYDQGFDASIKVVDNLIYGEMNTGLYKLRALERVVSEIRGGVGSTDKFNIFSPGGGEPPQNFQLGAQDMKQIFRTHPGMHPAEQGRPAWQPATPERQNARGATRQGPGPQQPEFAPVEVGNVQGATEVHFVVYGGVRAFKINHKGTENLKVFKGDMGSFKFWKNLTVDHL